MKVKMRIIININNTNRRPMINKVTRSIKRNKMMMKKDLVVVTLFVKKFTLKILKN
jgi:hypothetical protein